MATPRSRRCLAVLALLAGAAGAGACTEDFPLGAWGEVLAGTGGSTPSAGTGGSTPSAGTGGSTPSAGTGGSGGDGSLGGSTATGGSAKGGSDAGGDNGGDTGVAAASGSDGTSGSGPERPQPACLEPGEPGPLNTRGTTFGTTGTYTDWTWPSAVDSMEWTVTIETDYSENESGYYYAYQFAFTEGQSGFFGLQAGGGYQTDPPASPIDFRKIAVFWIAAPEPMRAELGDIAYPDARTYLQSQLGTTWWTIHTVYEWQPCRSYRLRIGPESTDASGDLWFGAWILDTVTNVETFVGRMLLPEGWGKLSPFASQRTSPIQRGTMAPSSCVEPDPSSVLFSEPTANDGTIRPALRNNRFLSPPRCPTSRFTDFEYAVRQELGVTE